MDPIRIICGDAVLGIKGNGRQGEFTYLFSYQYGGLISLVQKEKEWIYRAPTPCFWRATTDNDRGNGFSVKSSMWMGADQFRSLKGITLSVDGKENQKFLPPANNETGGELLAQEAELTYRFETTTIPAIMVELSYQISGDGRIRITMRYHGTAGLPQLPALGVRFLIPFASKGFRYQGLFGETYPDRMAGGVSGIYETQGLPVTPYLVPQECGMHMKTDWVEIYDDSEERKELLHADLNGLAFSCLPYTALELENATHQEELPPARRTVFCVYGKVRGVGGIDSWGSDVEEAYHIPADQEYEFSFQLC